jgi:hydroxymethylbilane synthase
VEIFLATRQSPLALAQAQLAREHIVKQLGLDSVYCLPMKTTGDKQLQWSLEAAGGKGLFTKELEAALLEGRADLAVHSAKDLPTQMDPRLCIVAYLPRACAQDMFICRSVLRGCPVPVLQEIDAKNPQKFLEFLDFFKTLEGPLQIATGSPRRREQMRRLLPCAEFRELRGNVATRLEKVLAGPAEATLLAAAGLARMGYLPWPGLQAIAIPLELMVPAAGQGAIALQCRVEDAARWEFLTHPPTHEAVTAERQVLSQKGGGCHSALGVHCAASRIWMFDSLGDL